VQIRADGQNGFKPDVVEWGQRGTLELINVLNQAQSAVPADDITVDGRGATTNNLGADASISANGHSHAATSETGPSHPRPRPPLGPSPFGSLSKPVQTTPDTGPDLDAAGGDADAEEADAWEPISSPPRPVSADTYDKNEGDGPPAKKQMTLDEYEKMLDEEDGSEGGFLVGELR
jgi:hypothetical protein